MKRVLGDSKDTGGGMFWEELKGSRAELTIYLESEH